MVARERERLREHERAFRRLTENATEVFWIADPDREGAVYVNPAFEEVWGRPCERFYEDHGVLIESIHPEDRTRVKRAIDRKYESGEFDETYRIQRPDGEVRWIHDRGFPVRDSAGDLVNVAGIATDITERKRIGSELRRQRDRIERVVETTPVMLLVMDADRTITFANERATAMAGVEDIAGTPFEEFPWELLRSDDSSGGSPDDRPWPDDWAAVPPDRRPFALVRELGEPVYDLQYPAWIGGEFRWLSINGAPLFDGAEFDGAVFAIEDVTERKRRERALSALHETSREMMRAESPAEIYEVAVSTVDDSLPFSRVACYRLDPGGYALEPVAHSPEAAGFVEEHDRVEDGGPIWEAFVGGGVERDGECTAIALGSHGVLVLVGRSEGALSLVRVLCDNAEAALDRTDREGVLRAQSEALRRTNAELERLNDVNDLVRDLTAALVRATSREEIAATVCERLAAAERYRFAWIGDETGTPTACAGITESALAAIERPESGYEPPAARALEDGEPAIDGDLLDAAHPDQRADALSKDYRSVAAVPLSYRDRTYGVLSVYADRDDAFREDEREVFAELGGTVGYAIDAVETRTALASDGVTELRFSIADREALPARLAAGARLEHRGLVPRPDGSIRWFVAVDAPVERVRETVAETERVEGFQEIVTDGTTLIECVVHPPCLLSPFVEHGATIADLTASGGEVTLTAAVAETDVRALSEALESRYDAELVRRCDRERPPRTREERCVEATEGLTDRQREILEIAHLSGYFETPRRITGAELAERLGVNRSTFHRTLRAAEQATFDALLE
ncbi:bacterio-opsin activator domain-containing protein [Halalkalicoccus sp. NIPERK01]|uniref:bacterio-opsin activator domain-containing protein n=1 Tax=Halalkalicoccus sp. NIPERK01 TaxID=3053469 RepID=UPI00256F5AB6|nr:bacterio-opsin activator domain-containing protein [Halalkalicoccus sp. NIPERK01]MDL5362144.1 bacterio-opsin activator domain-containing protein [Halalkalicoccus sp. NIPERK01]